MTSPEEPLILPGAKPLGAPEASPEAAAQSVQSMFDAIAGRYDLLNHLLSGGLDQYWWRRAARAVRGVLSREDARIVDLCCGTGDMTLALLRHRRGTSSTAPILAVDFSHQMLARGSTKFNGKNIYAVEADALHLPLQADSIDLISTAFGFRNLSNYEQGLAELFRVLRPGGEITILECNQPVGPVGTLYNLYFKRVLPRIGGWVSDRNAYAYLPTSVERFPRPPRMLEMMRAAGFESARWTSYTFGVAGLYQGRKRSRSRQIRRI